MRGGFILLAFTLLPLFAQAPQKPGQEGVIRITVNLVQVDAVVTDSKGRQVTNLRPEDFEILEDGRPQTITNFSYVFVTAPAGGGPNAQPSAVPAGVPSVPPVRLRPEQVRRTIAVVVDDLHLSFESAVYVRKALKKFVDEDMQPGDLVAILRTAGGLGALQQFTNDKRLLYAAIDRIHWKFAHPFGAFGPSEAASALEAGGPPRSARSQGDEMQGAREDLESARARQGEFRQQIYTVGTLGALNYVVTGLRDLPGRKSLVLLSDRMPSFSLDRPGVQEMLHMLVDRANRSSVVVYTIDTRGLPTLAFGADDDTIFDLPGPLGTLPARIAELPLRRQAEYLGSQGGLAGEK